MPLRGRKGDTWEGGCRVPAFVTNTGRQDFSTIKGDIRNRRPHPVYLFRFY
jgi:hypothetical protein